MSSTSSSSPREWNDRVLDRMERGGLAVAGTLLVVVLLISHSVWPFVGFGLGVLMSTWVAGIQAAREKKG